MYCIVQKLKSSNEHNCRLVLIIFRQSQYVFEKQENLEINLLRQVLQTTYMVIHQIFLYTDWTIAFALLFHV